MPVAPPSRCGRVGCTNMATKRGRCDECQPPPWANSSKSWQSGSSRKWREFRAQQLRDEPKCRRCDVDATEVDHILPLSEGGSKWDKANVQSLCQDCHGAKTLEDRRRKRRPSGMTF